MPKKEIVGVRIKLATPKRIEEISCGEVLKPETINYRTLRPETDGLFCEKIFGPTRSYECKCGKYKRSGPKFKGVICEHCGVEVTDNRVRRERMGHIKLAVPVVHIWYLRGVPSRLSLLLGTGAKDLEKVIYFAPVRKGEGAWKVISTSHPDIVEVGEIISDSDLKIHEHYDPDSFRAEKAYSIEYVDTPSVKIGELISAQQLSKLRTEWGHDVIKAEPAYTLTQAFENSKLEVGAIVPVSELNQEDGIFNRAKNTSNEESFIVTSAPKLPFAKGDVVSESELSMMKQRYTNRFREIPHVRVIDEPCHLVINPGDSPFEQGDVILERQEILCSRYDPKFVGGIGADGIEALIKELDLDLLSSSLREEIAGTTGQKKRKLVKRLQVVEDFRKSDSDASSMILNVLPVIPPDLRPLVQLDGGRFATSDLNDLYRRVINRNNRLKKLQQLNAPEIIIRNEKRMLQECVDALIDNGRVGKAVLGAGNRPLKSLTDLLRGKKGRFRQNLLGKRVDYSGRSVIVIGPELKIYQCGLPKQMALELFKPFVIRRLVDSGLAPNVKSARRQIERGREEIWEILENIIKDHPVMLNRAPTLHRLGIQAFEPVLMEGKAIRLHPMVCTAFNADFDGDQMAVHVPLSIEAQAEARLLMLSANNLLSPASGRPVVTPTQDIVLGVYYLTDMRPGLLGEGKHFANADDVLDAISHGIVHVNTRIWLRETPEYNNPVGNREYSANKKIVFFETSPGRVIFNQKVPQKLRFVNFQLGKKQIGRLLDDAYDEIDRPGVVEMLDEIKSLGYHWAARSGISFGVQAVRIPEEKAEITAITQSQDDIAKSNYDMGLLTYDEYLDQKSKLWGQATKDIAESIKEHMDPQNPVRMMVESGARGSLGQMGQMAGIRGLMSDPTGKTIDYPITANFREGMNMLEYFISTHGARKGLADTALRTAKSGYLTRRLVDVSQDLIITEYDCGTDKGICIKPLTSEGKTMIGIADRIAGRTSLNDIVFDGEVIVSKNEIITEKIAKKIESLGFDEVWVRSPLSCALKHGVCQKCYGNDLSSRKLVPIGEAVGVVAAQSIGEPGTQLTMRTFHTGGVRSAEDITQGLPRIEQLFEARRPRKVCILAGLDGFIEEITPEGKRKVVISSSDGTEKITHTIPSNQELKEGIEVGMFVQKLTPLTEGSIDPQQLLEVSGIDAVQKMLVDEIQYVYHSQGVSINNKHIEVILRKVAPLNKVRVIEEGDTPFVAGDIVFNDDAENAINEIHEDNKKRLTTAVDSFGSDILVSVDAHADPEIQMLEGRQLNENSLYKILTPGKSVTSMVLRHDDQEVEVIIGKASFQKQMLGLRTVRDIRLRNWKIKKSTVLGRDELRRITDDRQEGPVIIRVRDKELLSRMVNNKWISEDLYVGSRLVATRDTLIDEKVGNDIAESGLREIRVWHSVEKINVIETVKNVLIDRELWGKELSDGTYVDNQVISDFATGVTNTIELYEDGEVITRNDVIDKILMVRLKNKILLSAKNAEGEEILPLEGMDELVSKEPVEIIVRSTNVKSDLTRLIRDVTFVQKMREEPVCRPFIHGITKAALATESFLSAASFQQTAQILAGAAVKGQSDPLSGLKENVIIGHLIPAGTGAMPFRSISYKENKELRRRRLAEERKENAVETSDLFE